MLLGFVGSSSTARRANPQNSFYSFRGTPRRSPFSRRRRLKRGAVLLGFVDSSSTARRSSLFTGELRKTEGPYGHELAEAMNCTFC